MRVGGQLRYVADPVTGCWVYIGARNAKGYGRVELPMKRGVRGRRVRAHRLAWLRARGAIPAGMFVLHSCDNPPCINPDHLFLGTNSDNMTDMVRKGRHPCQRITIAQAEEVTRRILAGQRRAEIVAATGVPPSVCSDIRRGDSWRHAWPTPERVKP